MGWNKEKLKSFNVTQSQSPRIHGVNKEEVESSVNNEDVGEKDKKPIPPFYRTGGDGEAERRQWERRKLAVEEDGEDLDDSILDDEDEENVENDPGGVEGETGTKSLSDSLIPQVGDSLCERNEALEGKKGEGGVIEEAKTVKEGGGEGLS